MSVMADNYCCVNGMLCVYIYIFFLFREVERGMQTGVPLDSTSVAQSSQYHLIQNKPDYHSLLRRQQPLLNTVSLIVSWTSDFYDVKKRKHSIRFTRMQFF